MRRDEVKSDVSTMAFEFFFWFSRFEFALKANGHLKSCKSGSVAEPGWESFVNEWSKAFAHTAHSAELVALAPERQMVGLNKTLEWKQVGVSDCSSDLQVVVRLLKTVRNNLFHGGKHGGAGWGDPCRTLALLSAGVSVLNDLAELASWQSDYTQYY